MFVVFRLGRADTLDSDALRKYYRSFQTDVMGAVKIQVGMGVSWFTVKGSFYGPAM